MPVSEKYEVYKCNTCGNVIIVTTVGGGELICCGEAMELLEPRQLEEGGVKHIPIIKKEDDKIIVEVGEVSHPMDDDHYIAFIELIVNDKIYVASLNPGDEPKAVFDVCADVADCKANEYCTKHGLWNS